MNLNVFPDPIESAPQEQAPSEPFSLRRFLFGESARVTALRRQVESLTFKNELLEEHLQDQGMAMEALRNMVANVGQLHLIIARQNGYQPPPEPKK